MSIYWVYEWTPEMAHTLSNEIVKKYIDISTHHVKSEELVKQAKTKSKNSWDKLKPHVLSCYPTNCKIMDVNCYIADEPQPGNYVTCWDCVITEGSERHTDLMIFEFKHNVMSG